MSTRQTRMLERANAQLVKAQGGGSSATATRATANSIFGDVLGVIGTAIGGPAGGIIGKGLGELGSGLFGGGGGGGSFGSTSVACPPGTVRLGSACINLPLSGPPGVGIGTVGAAAPVVAAGGQAVIGSFGLPARAPIIEVREFRECGPGLVLGKDNLCYPKAVLSRRSQFRKWRQPPRPKFTAADMRAIRRAESLVDDVKDLNRAVGLRVPSKPKKK